MTRISRRFTALVAAGALPTLASQCAAQEFPSRPIRFVVPFGAGGSPDVIARVIGKKLGENVGQPVIVDNGSAPAASSPPKS